jgi:hypothetical protein
LWNLLLLVIVVFRARCAVSSKLVEIFKVSADFHIYRKRRTFEGLLPYLAIRVFPIHAVSAVYASGSSPTTVVIHKELASAKLG